METMFNKFMNWIQSAETWFDGGLRMEWGLSLAGVVMAVVVYTAIRVFAQTSKSQSWSTDQRRQTITQARNILWVLTAFWLVMAWSKMLFPFLFSIVALLVALVMATKEWILCILGSTYRFTTSAYNVGDHIKINGVRGEVIDVQWLQTRVLEMGPAPDGTYYTGNVLGFPNSWLLTHHLTNETFFPHYGFHWITFPLTVADNIEDASMVVMEEAARACEPFLAEAQKDLARIQQSHFMEAPSVKPKIQIDYAKPGEIHINLRFPAPRGKNNELAQKIMNSFLKRYAPAVNEKWNEGHLRERL